MEVDLNNPNISIRILAANEYRTNCIPRRQQQQQQLQPPSNYYYNTWELLQHAFYMPDNLRRQFLRAFQQIQLYQLF